MEAFSGLLTTSKGDSAAVRIVVDLDTLTVVLRDEPVAGWPLEEVKAERAGPEIVSVSAPDERFTLTTPQAERLLEVLERRAAEEAATAGRWRPGRHRRAGPTRDALARMLADARHVPRDPAVWLLAAGVFIAIVLTVWSIAG